MKIVWTDPAVEDLRELHSYIARDSPVYASEFVGRIISAAESVVGHPKVGRVVPEKNDVQCSRASLSTLSNYLSPKERSY